MKRYQRKPETVPVHMLRRPKRRGRLVLTLCGLRISGGGERPRLHLQLCGAGDVPTCKTCHRICPWEGE